MYVCEKENRMDDIIKHGMIGSPYIVYQGKPA